MPNYSSNTLIISGNVAKVKNVFGLPADADLLTYLLNTEIRLRHWFPMPQTFLDHDTTNAKLSRNAVDRKKVIADDGNGIKTYAPRFETDEEYEAYSKAYDDAVKYQAETYGCVGWYNYNLMTLGCKWDSELTKYKNFTVTEYGGQLKVQFDFETPWSAPEPWFDAMVDKYPDLNWSLEAHEEADFFNFITVYDPESKTFDTTDLPPQYEPEDEEDVFSGTTSDSEEKTE